MPLNGGQVFIMHGEITPPKTMGRMVIEPEPRVLPAKPMPLFWKRVSGEQIRKCITKEERATVKRLLSEQAELTSRSEEYSDPKAEEKWKAQDFTTPDKLRSKGEMAQAFKEVREELQRKHDAKQAEINGILATVQGRLLAVVEKIDVAEQLRKRFMEVVNEFNLGFGEYFEKEIKYFAISHREWCEVIRQKQTPFPVLKDLLELS